MRGSPWFAAAALFAIDGRDRAAGGRRIRARPLRGGLARTAGAETGRDGKTRREPDAGKYR